MSAMRAGLRISRFSLLGTTAMVALASAGAAHAQTQPAPPPAAAEQTQVEEVVVTAQRRSENLQSVPLSVTAISGAEIRNQDINDLSRLEQVVPGLRLGRSGAAERPAIRGVYTEAIGINSDPRIGFYIDEVYQSRPQQTTATLVDLERVEVQKGPQGTLFGRNSYGGNIALTTATPKDKVEGGIDITGGNYGRFRVEGYYNLPLAPGLDARVAAEYERHDGYLESSVNKGAGDLQDKDEFYIRGSLKWTPPQLENKLEVLLHASYYKRDDHGFNSVNAKVIGVAEDPSLVTAPGGTISFNGVPFTFANGFNGLNVGTGTLYPYTNAVRDGIADVNGADIGILIPGKYKSVYDAVPHENLEQQQYSGTVSYSLSPWAKLRSITAYAKFSTVNGGDGDGTPLPLLYYATGTDAETFSQEFQLQSNHAGPLQYTVGGYYLYDKDQDGSNNYYLNRTYTTAGATALGLPTYYGSTGSCQFRYTTTSACNLNYASGNLYDYPLEDAARTQSYAAYAQASYTIDKLTLTGGIRYTVDHKIYKSTVQNDYVSTYLKGLGASATTQANSYAVYPSFSDTFANLTCGGYTPLGYSTGGSSQAVGQVPDYFVTRCGVRDFEFTTYRLAADYKLTSNNLLYASFNTGRHSGGFGASVFAATAPGGSFSTFNSEGVEALELGSKNRFFDGKLQVNVAAFYNNYTHLQQQGTQVINNTNVTTIFNIGSEHAPGVDFDIVAKPWRNLTLNLAVNYLHARYSAYPAYVNPSYICYYDVGPGCTTGGVQNYSTTAAVNYGVGGGYFPNAYTNPNQFAATNISGYNYAYVATDRRVQNQPDWSMQFGARYDFDLPGGSRLVPEFHSLFSSEYLLSPSAPKILQGAYVKTDVRVTWWAADGRTSVQGFVQNLEAVPTLGRITVGANGQIQGTYDDPRTFGVKVGYHF